MRFSFIGLAPAFLISGVLIFLYLRAEKRRVLALEWIKGYKSPTPEEICELIKKYGQNSNSFMTLYKGFHFLASKNPGIKGKVAFVNAPYGWVGATEPISESAEYPVLLQEFAESAKSVGKKAMVLPVSRSTAKAAKAMGYGSLMIGTEPTFVLDQYDPRPEIVPSAKALASKGARVVEFVPSQISISHQRELDGILFEWLEMRKITPLSFLNKVAPWELSQFKKYFWVEQNGSIMAFLAAIPIFPRQGWYLIDLLRLGSSPPGSTELLVLEAMRILKDQGAKEITLGVAPLSGLNEADTTSHPLLYPVLRLVFESGNLFYRFKPLYQFKMKFKPTYCEPAYLLYNSRSIGFFDTLSLMEAFFPGGILNATLTGFFKVFRNLNLSAWLKKEISETTVARSIPGNGIELIKRCKITLSLLMVNVLVYVTTTDRFGRILKDVVISWGFSWNSFKQNAIKSLIFSPFLHFDLLHINLNIITLLFFCGLLECLGGGTLMMVSYLIAMIFTNPLTSLLFIEPFYWISFHHWISFSSDIDVGASLGVYGCAGGLVYFLKKGRMLVLLLGAFSVAFTLLAQTPQFMNHAVALVIGVVVGRMYLGD